MDKNLFTTLLHRYTGSSVQEAEEVVALKAEYPYSQLLHTLSARVTKDHGFDSQHEALQMAAIHAADRGVLKEIITARYVETETAATTSFTPVTIQETPSPAPEFQAQRNDATTDVADELMRDLDKLNTLKNNFEMLLVEYSEVQAEEKAAPPVKEPVPVKEPTPLREFVEVTESTEDEEEEPLPDNEPTKHPAVRASTSTQDTQDAKAAPKKRAKSKKQRIIELAKAMNAAEATEEKSQHDQAGTRHNNPSDELIEEILVSKDEIVPESDKQKEQMEIINHFIKIQPSISNAKDRQGHPIGDLNPIKSGEFGDNIVSETLVEILVRQGKKDKAIEVLKKLIWKYPQKKSYFATQIEDLKK